MHLNGAVPKSDFPPAEIIYSNGRGLDRQVPKLTFMPESRRLLPSELGHFLIMHNEVENLRWASRLTEEELALALVDEGLFLCVFPYEQREDYARWLLESGLLAKYRGLLLERLSGRELDAIEFEFLNTPFPTAP